MAEDRNELVEPHRNYRGCSSIKEYEVTRKLGEGTFGEVYQGYRNKTGELVALKKILMHNEKDGFPITALREIKLLKTLSHLNVIKLEEMAVERSRGKRQNRPIHPSAAADYFPKESLKKRAVLFMVTPYMEHDLSGMLDNPEINVTEPMRKCYMQQLLHGLNYLHQNQILHRDMKAANLLISNNGILKIADFGLARIYDGPTPQPGRGGGEATRDYTSLVVTRWYRPPELLLQLRRYTTAIDLWGAGCVFGEMYKRKPILTGQSDVHQAQIIFELVGTPNNQTMPGWDSLPAADTIRNMDKSYGRIDEVFADLNPHALSLLKSLLKLDWRARVNAIDALTHPYFTTPPLPARPEDIPRFKDSHELDRRNHRPNKALPPAPQGGTVGGGAGAGAGAGSNPEWSGEYAASYHDRLSQDRPHGNRMPRGVENRDHNAHARSNQASRIHGGAQINNRRSAWDATERHIGDSNGFRRESYLPAPPAEGAKHPLPANPHRNKKDTYIPAYTGPEEGRSRTPDRIRSDDRRDRYRDDRRRDDFRDREDTRNERYSDRRCRSRSPPNADRNRDRGKNLYRDG